jgi:hypothetical protein
LVESKENVNRTYQNLWLTANAVLRRKFIDMSAYIKKSGRSQINNNDALEILRKTRIRQISH